MDRFLIPSFEPLRVRSDGTGGRTPHIRLISLTRRAGYFRFFLVPTAPTGRGARTAGSGTGTPRCARIAGTPANRVRRRRTIAPWTLSWETFSTSLRNLSVSWVAVAAI